jgi:hypothetical protein
MRDPTITIRESSCTSRFSSNAGRRFESLTTRCGYSPALGAVDGRVDAKNCLFQSSSTKKRLIDCVNKPVKIQSADQSRFSFFLFFSEPTFYRLSTLTALLDFTTRWRGDKLGVKPSQNEGTETVVAQSWSGQCSPQRILAEARSGVGSEAHLPCHRSNEPHIPCVNHIEQCDFRVVDRRPTSDKMLIRCAC